jgi:hypothetical protein
VPLVKVTANMYAKMAYKVLDKKWSIGVDFVRIDIALFIFAYFFVYYMAGDEKRALDIATSISALSSAVEGRQVAINVVNVVPNQKEPFKSFNDAITLLNKCLTDIVPIDTLVYIGAYAQHWQGSTVPGLDYLPYFVMTIVSSYIGGGFAKDIAVAQLLLKDADNFIKLLSDTYKD